MASGSTAVDLSNLPDVLRLAEEVRASGKSRVLRRGDEDVAVITPVTPSRRHSTGERTQADYEAFRSAAGAWADIDTDQLIADIYEDRRGSDRPPVRL